MSQENIYDWFGLGDIIIPGVYVAFILRFDIYLYDNAKKIFLNMEFLLKIRNIL